MNPALLAKLDTDFGIKLPSLDDVEEVDVNAYLGEVHAIVEKRGWSVQPEAFLDTFSFHKEVMYRDLQTNEAAIVAHDLVRTLALGANAEADLGFDPPSQEDLDERHPPEETTTILDADASQRVCIAAARSNRTFVMDGPPGTGKSQTIANLIAQSITEGKTVLFVSEKIAALEVVKARLDRAGLGEYLLEMHSHKATRKEVAQTLHHSLLNHAKPKSAFNSQEVGVLRERRRELSEYSTALNEMRPVFGRSLFNAVGRASQLQALPQAPLPSVVNLSFEARQFNEIMDRARDLQRAWGPVARKDDFVWHGLGLENASLTGKRVIEGRLASAGEALSGLERRAHQVASALEVWWDRAPDQASALLTLAEHLETRQPAPASWLTRSSFDEVDSALRRLSHEWGAWGEPAAALEDGFGAQWRKVRRNGYVLIETAVSGLTELRPAFVPDADSNAGATQAQAAFAGRSAGVLRGLHEESKYLAAGLGLDAAGISIEGTEKFTLLSELIGSINPPERQWLDPLAMPLLEETSTILRKLVEASRRKAEELSSLFKPEVVKLDLEGLKARFDDLHRGLRKLSGSYRTDKRTLAACTRTGKVTKVVRAAMGDALEWQRLKSDLAQAEERHAVVLGDHYYRGERTDFGDVSSAIEIARKALELAGNELANRERFASQFARVGTPDPQLKVLGSEIRESVGRWRQEAERILGPVTAEIEPMPLETAAGWFDQQHHLCADLAAEFERAEAVAQRQFALRELRELLKARSQIEDLETHLASTWEDDLAMLGGAYRAMDTDWSGLEAAVHWTRRLRELTNGPVDDVQAELILTVELDPVDLRVSLLSWDRARDALAGLFAESEATELNRELNSNYSEAAELLAVMERSMGDIDEWASFVNSGDELASLGLGEVVRYMTDRSVETDHVGDVVERAILEAWIDRIFEADTRLDTLRSSDRDALVEEFRSLDRKLIERMPARVVAACNTRRPQTTIGVAGIILREGQKKRRHMPVRDLIEQAAGVVQALKPCFMMSPLSVSQFLTSALRFDLVIFDEASQVKPADAVNCVYRGRQLIVAGDQKQLPPTAFFDRVTLDGGDEYDEEAVDEFESVLDLAKAGGVASLPLRWHYRSQHEGLITYSNYSFYDGKLVTFPSAQDRGADIGLELFIVDGQYRRGGARDNPIEAKAVADRVLFHARHHPDLTLGVVAFSEAQASTIERVLDQERRAFPDLDDYFIEDRLTGFFIKNLENVQGDERDIMIFSIGYGPDEVGKLTMNFGPLNQRGGQRRLNVAITRARRRVEVVSSIRPEDFSDTGSEGPRHLRRYLDFINRGMAALAIDVQQGQLDSESPFEDEVLRVVRGWGYDVVPQVGVAEYRIDLAVIHPDEPGLYVLAIECDGAMYHSSPVARDRDRLRQQVLEGLGWIVYRIWGPAWYRDRVGEERRLKEAIANAIAGLTPAKRAVLEEPTAIVPELEEVFLDRRPSWAEEYRVCRPYVRRGYEIHEPEAQRALRDAMEQVIEIEAPMSQEILLTRVREAWGLGRAGARVRVAFVVALTGLRKDGKVTIDRFGFLWQPGQQLSTVRIPSSDPDTLRSQAYVPWEELRLAVLKLVQDARHVSWDELTAAVAKLFGWARRGSDISAALAEAVRYLIKSGQLVRNGDQLSASE